jgi:apolipoprotein N-acyltransferase
VVYWFGVCYWIQFVLAFHGGLGNLAGWAVFLLFCFVKALHMGVFAWLAGILMRRWWAVPAVAALWVAVEATHGSLGFAWLALGNAGIDMAMPMRLAPITGVYGLSFVFMMMAAALALAPAAAPRLELLWLILLPFLVFLPPLPPAQRGHETALLTQPNISETEDWTPESIDRCSAGRWLSPCAACWWKPGSRPRSWSGRKSPRRSTTTKTRAFAATPTPGARHPRLPADWPGGAHRRRRAAQLGRLISPEGGLVSRYDKVNLVPFGEYVPWPFGFANKISTELGDFVAGKRVVVSRRWTATRSAHSSATNPCCPISCASSRPAAPKC